MNQKHINQPIQRRRWTKVNDWSLGTKIFVLVLTSSVVVSIFIILFDNNVVRQMVHANHGQELINTADFALRDVEKTIKISVKTLEALALSPSIVEAVQQANQAYQGREPAQIEEESMGLDTAWKRSDSSIQPLVDQIANNPTSDFLLRFIEAFPEEVEVFVTDQYGLNVAMTDRTSDYLQSDEEWWQTAYHHGAGAVSIGSVDYDASSETWAVDVGVPVRDIQSQEVIGVLRGTVDISVIFTDLSSINFGGAGYVVLIDPDGQILYSRDHKKLMQQVPAEIYTWFHEPLDTWHTDTPDLDGKPAMLVLRAMGDA